MSDDGNSGTEAQVSRRQGSTEFRERHSRKIIVTQVVAGGVTSDLAPTILIDLVVPHLAIEALLRVIGSVFQRQSKVQRKQRLAPRMVNPVSPQVFGTSEGRFGRGGEIRELINTLRE